MFLRQVPLVPYANFRLGNAPGAADWFPADPSIPPQPVNYPTIPPGSLAPKAEPGKPFCVTVGPASAPDSKKIKDLTNASGKFWLYPETAIGPGDQKYVVWCNAFATPPAGAVEWTPGNVQSTGSEQSAPSAQTASPGSSILPVAAGVGVIGLLVAVVSGVFKK